MTRAAEHTHVDPSNGRIVNANLAEYHVPSTLTLAPSRFRRSIFRIPKSISSERAGLVKLALPVRGRRLPMRFITPTANGFAICRSLRTN